MSYLGVFYFAHLSRDWLFLALLSLSEIVCSTQQPVQGGRIGERRASSPFQNGRTEVLIGEPEGGPRSPRGSTSSAVNDGNFLNPPDERDEPICR